MSFFERPVFCFVFEQRLNMLGCGIRKRIHTVHPVEKLAEFYFLFAVGHIGCTDGNEIL